MLAVRKHVSSSTEDCTQLVLHQGKEETTCYHPNCQPGPNLTVFTLPVDSRLWCL